MNMNMNMNVNVNVSKGGMSLTMDDSLQLVRKKFVEFDDREECEDWCYHELGCKTKQIYCCKKADGKYLFSFPLKNSNYNYNVLLDNSDGKGNKYIKNIIHNYL